MKRFLLVFLAPWVAATSDAGALDWVSSLTKAIAKIGTSTEVLRTCFIELENKSGKVADRLSSLITLNAAAIEHNNGVIQDALEEIKDNLVSLDKDIDALIESKKDYETTKADYTSFKSSAVTTSNFRDSLTPHLSEYAKRSVTDNHEARISTLEHGDIGGGVVAVGGNEPDGKTVVSNSVGRLALKNTPTDGTPKAEGYYIPYLDHGGELQWEDSAKLSDEDSIKWRTATGEFLFSGWCVKGWHDDGSCKEKLSDMMADPSHEKERGAHEILCRYGGKGGALHYLPLGGIIQPPLSVDGVTVSTNETGHAGQAAIKGAFSEANRDRALFSTGAGIEWRDAAGGAAITFVGTDKSSVTVGSGATTNTVTFASASDSNVKVSVTGGGSSVKVEIGVYYR